MGISREGWGLRDGKPPNKKKTPPNKKKTPFEQEKNTFRARKKHQQTRKTPFEQGKRLSSKGYLPIKCKSLQVAGVPRQGKAVVSDGGYGVIGGGYCLLVWGDAEETKGKRGRCHGMAGYGCRPPFFLAW